MLQHRLIVVRDFKPGPQTLSEVHLQQYYEEYHMKTLPQFDPPANQDDFQPGEEQKRRTFRARWNNNLNRFTEQTLQNDPWTSTRQIALTEYYNPLNIDISEGQSTGAIAWRAFPRRLERFGQDRHKYGDEGPPESESDNPALDTSPRGWQDEYCEWSVTRDPTGKITKVMFTSENREYWHALWEIDPEIVLRLYQQLVGDQVQLEDLYLKDRNDNPIIDRETGRPAYDDRNQWNNNTRTGAVHLISPPNNLSAEIFLAGQATLLRQTADGRLITDNNALINCSRYGNPGRNSDPLIGGSVNAAVRGENRISLENPAGLYIQTPDFGSYVTPDGSDASDYFRIVRGHQQRPGEPMDYILHAVFEVPPDRGFTVSDITIDGEPIEYGSQIVETMDIALVGLTLPPVDLPPGALLCRPSPGGSGPPNENRLPRPVILRDLNMLLSASRGILDMRIEPGTTVENVALVASNIDEGTTIEFIGAPGISVEGLRFESDLLIFTMTAAEDAPLGNRSLLLTDSKGFHGPARVAMLEVVAPGTLASQQSPRLATPPPSAPVPFIEQNDVYFMGSFGR